MKLVVVKGKKREALGKKDAKKLRAEDIVPAVLYGGDEVIHFSVPFSDLRSIMYTPNVYLIDLEIDGVTHRAIMQDVQWHPVHEQILHVDFLKVYDDKPVKISIPVKITGMAKGVKSGGKLKNNLRLLKVKALAKDLPDVVEINVTKLEIGQSIKVDDLSIEKIEFLDSKSAMVVSVISSRAAKAALGALPEDEEDEAAAAEGEVEGVEAEGEGQEETKASEE